MTTVIFRRKKCIGCNYCTEIDPKHWQMSKKDGKSNLIGGIDKKGFWTLKIQDSEREKVENAAKVCPVKVIEVRD